MTDETNLTLRQSFASWFTENLRFSDTDMIGHVNNVAFAALLESGRTMYTRANNFPQLPRGFLLVMARVEIDYRMEVHWPGKVDIGTRVLRVGNSSFVLGQGIFLGDACAASGRTTLVMIDKTTRRSAKLPEDFRRALAQDFTHPPAPAIPVP